MASLAQLLASHRRILAVDAASSRVQVGLLQPDAPRWWTADAEAGQAVFDGAATVLDQADTSLVEVEAFAFCEGPGSMLGIRTVAMALRTWTTLRARPVYSYQSLALAACAEHHRSPRAFAVIADARRDMWHCQTIAADGVLGPLQRLPATALPAGERLTPERFRAWAPLPDSTAACPYDLAAMWMRVADRDLLRAVAAPDAHQHEAPEYKRWSAQVHSVESAVRP